MCLLIVGFLIALYLSQKPIAKENCVPAETVKETVAIKQGTIVSPDVEKESTPKENGVENIPSPILRPPEKSEDSRLLETFEEFSKMGTELARIRRLRGDFSEEEHRQWRALDMHLWILFQILRDVAKDERKRDMLEDFRLIVDYRDGELRLPLINRYNELLRLVRQPELTEDDRGTIRQIIRELNESAKTNTPTSAFQAPKGKEG